MDVLVLYEMYLSLQMSTTDTHGRLSERSVGLRINAGSFTGFLTAKGVRSIPLSVAITDVRQTAVILSWKVPLDRAGLKASWNWDLRAYMFLGLHRISKAMYNLDLGGLWMKLRWTPTDSYSHWLALPP